ncbi:hypothetical protein DP130_12255 [Clostridium tetani]|uniref:SCP domain-containing protein n=2 Tax=Clostridium tetani TaxID=1513 RepID=A0A4Q0V967_CLOTA|nr:hypothetical protein C3B72_13135 [Clostridium tetani]RXI45378.1 hypothetical protein DP130_12255 [Clostridium tetani]RXI74632.1 hypothetical protein DP128_12690 [Clostridium tetani]
MKEGYIMNKKLLTIVLSCALVSSISYNVDAKILRVNRLSGKTRYETSEKIAKEYKMQSNEIGAVILALGTNYPDALSGAVLSKKYNAPILLTTNENKNLALDFIKENLPKGKNVYILGGNGGINNNTESQIKSMGYNTLRLGGSDRYHTNSEIVKNLNPKKGTPIILANSQGFADALSVSPVASSKGYPIFLVSKDKIYDPILSDIKKLSPSEIYVIGGQGSVSDKVVKEVADSTKAKVTRLSGKDRYETSLNIARHFFNEKDNISIASGLGFADALSGSALASLKNEALVLVDNNSIKTQSKFIEEFTNLDIFGGTGSVSENTVNILKGDTIKSQPSTKPDSTTKSDNINKEENIIKPSNNNNSLSDAYKNEVTNKMLQLVNELRASKGVKPLSIIPILNNEAEKRSQHMAKTGEFSHNDTNGNFIFKDELAKINYTYRSIGENIAQNMYTKDPQKQAEALFTQWKNSPGHYKNMVNKDFNQLGFGIEVNSQGLTYATQVFVGK